MTQGDEKTYEMLWDCEYCSTKKLLGKSHRHCPECGAAQNADKRYFPEEDEKVAVEDHRFVGADRHCPACHAPNSAIAKHCTECGSPMEEGEAVRGVDEPKPPGPRTAAKPRSKTKLWVTIGVVLLVVIGVVAAALLCKKKVSLTVTGHSWAREIQIESFKEVRQSEWCDHTPPDARSVTRSREVRSHKKIPDGETCSTTRVDNKDGTFQEKQVCTTRYREEPVYGDKCRFTVSRWQVSRSVKREGRNLAETPEWPTVDLKPNAAEVLGAERPKERIETYTVHLTGPENAAHTCDFKEGKWRSFGMSSRWKGESGMLTDHLDCDTLKPTQ